MNWIDILIVILLLRISYVAFQNGLSHELFPLLASAAIAVLSLHYYNKIALFISQNIINIAPEKLNFVTFLAILLLSWILLKIFRVVLNKVIQVSWHPVIDKVGGLLAGVAKASIAASLILTGIVLAPLSYMRWSVQERSVAGMHFLKVAPTIYEKVSKLMPAIKVDGKTVNKEEVLKELLSKSYVPIPKAPKTEKGLAGREKTGD